MFCYSYVIFSLKLTDQRDLLNTELSQATSTRTHGNVESDECRRLQAENAALRKSLGGSNMM